MELWLRCVITPGQFDEEYAVEAQTHNGTGFSLFAGAEDLECKSYPTGADRTHAWLRVRELKRRGDLVLVQLPQSTLENGNTVTVRLDQVEARHLRGIRHDSVQRRDPSCA